MGEIGDYVERNRKAGGLYISLNGEETNRALEEMCERVVGLEYVQQDEARSFGSTNNL
jgi:hypothetical protein